MPLWAAYIVPLRDFGDKYELDPAWREGAMPQRMLEHVRGY
jgi:hypothetical protein